ncbi:MAG: hypothetical protein KAW84_07420 [Thermoplasmata archaeon]|nr:hypothetical protein [Thermoplasmata archaeon]
MSILHNVRFRAYSHATEDKSRVESAMRCVSGAQNVETETLKGHHGNPLVKMTVFLSKRKDLEAFLGKLKTAGILEEILGTLDRRMDEEGSLHMRLSKQAAYKGRIEITEKDDAISLTAKVRAYPANRDVALRVLVEALRE